MREDEDIKTPTRDVSNNYLFQRKKLVYSKAAELISGNVLQIGVDNGLAESIIASKVASLTIVDKYNRGRSDNSATNMEYHLLKFPSLAGLTSSSFDYVLSFQSIEHIKDDFLFVSEVARVLRPGGKFIVSTPNKKMSITRNPCHYREYTIDEFKNLLRSYFKEVEAQGVYGKENVMQYYELNKKYVKAFTRFDVFNLQYALPRFILLKPYKLLNRMNRRKMLVENRNLTTKITMDDYYVGKATDECFDLFYIATK